MFIEIKPTTTLAASTQNNTSAADSFPGWPNGVSKPAAVSHVPIPCQQLKLVHRCDWWGYGSHPDIGIHSNDPAYATKSAADMKARGLDGCTLDWYGSGSNEDKSLLVLKPQLEAIGLKFAVMVDGGTRALKTKDATFTVAQRTAALNAQLDYVAKTYFGSPVYLRFNGRPIVQFFGVSAVDWNAVRAHIHTYGSEPLLFFRFEKGSTGHTQADGYFGWRHCDEQWVTEAKATGKIIMLGANGGFNSSISGPPVNCTWGNTDIDPQEGGLRMQTQIALSTAHPEIPMVQFATWNDYQEGSALEPGLASGVTIGLELSSGVLNWSGGPMFDHYDVLVSADGVNFMPLTRSDVPMLVDLDALEFKPGSYYFAILATGKPMVQNVVSNVIKANLAWA